MEPLVKLFVFASIVVVVALLAIACSVNKISDHNKGRKTFNGMRGQKKIKGAV